MLKRLAATAAIAAAVTVGSIGAASAAPPNGAGTGGKPAGVACQQQGISTLQSAGLLSAVARNGVYVYELDRVVPFPEVLSLHRSNPALFQSGTGVTVLLPGGPVQATWCDGV